MNISEIPKVELHCHLDGIVSASIVAAFRGEDPDYPIRPEDFHDIQVRDYDSFWQWWPIIRPVSRHLHYLSPAGEYYIEQLKQQNVQYFELMLNGGSLPEDTSEALDAVQAFREQVNQQEKGKIQVEFLIAHSRENTAENMRGRADKMIALYEAGLICGIAIAGRELDNPVQRFHKTLARWHEAGLGIEIHAGEWAGPESVWDALNYGYPDRIGHGVSLFDDPKLIEIFQEQQIHIEMCPSSNLKTSSVKRIEDHPIKQALELGLNFSINTDDPGPFQCSMDGEYDLLATTFGFTVDDFQTIYVNSLAARFQEDIRFVE